MAAQVEREQDPDVGASDPELFHVVVGRAADTVDGRTTESRPFVGKNVDACLDRDLLDDTQTAPPGLELVGVLNLEHTMIITCGF